MMPSDKKIQTLCKMLDAPHWDGISTHVARDQLMTGRLLMKDLKKADALLRFCGIRHDAEVDETKIRAFLTNGSPNVIGTGLKAAFVALSPESPVVPVLYRTLRAIGRERSGATRDRDDRSLLEVLHPAYWSSARTAVLEAVNSGQVTLPQVRMMDNYLAFAETGETPTMSVASFLSFAGNSADALRLLAPVVPSITSDPDAKVSVERAIRQKGLEVGELKGSRDMRSFEDVLSQPRWNTACTSDIAQHIVSGTLTLTEIRRLDRLLAFLEDRCTDHTKVDAEAFLAFADLHKATQSNFSSLRRTIRIIFENSPLLRTLDEATGRLSRRTSKDKPDRRSARKLTFSVRETELPQEWKSALADMRAGMPGEEIAPPSKSITVSVVRKVCEFAKTAADTGLPVTLTRETAAIYERSLLSRERPLAAATIHSSMVHIRDFARYIGAPVDLVAYLTGRVRVHENRANKAPSQNEVKVQKIPTYTEIFELAFEMLGEADAESHPRRIQKLRNYAAAITLLCPFPLRVADTLLMFGTNITWTGTTYKIFVPATHKNGEPFRAQLLPFFCIFVDAMILQGASPEHLEDLREQCMRSRRMLFVNYDGLQPHENYVSYAWRKTFGTGSHIARTKVHDELAVLGPRGVELALAACTHRSAATAEYYRTLAFQMLAGDHVHHVLQDGITEQEWERYF